MNLDIRQAALQRDLILTASPAQLVTMLYDRMLLDLERARLHQEQQRHNEAGEHLKHAQAIVTELQTTLDLSVWDGAAGLFALYTYLRTAMMRANLDRSLARTEECIRLIEPLAASWHAAAAQTADAVAAQPTAAHA